MAPRYGATTVPNELNACEKVRRKWDLAGGPNAAASGLAAICSTVMPAPMMKSATSTRS